MDIPVHTATKINPYIDALSKSIVYTFREIHSTNDSYSFFKFPYVKNTCWTNFRYLYYDQSGEPINSDINLEIILITSDGYTYNIQNNIQNNTSNNIWHETQWPIPSVNTNDSGGLYFKVKLPSTAHTSFKIHLLGFMDLFPEVDTYLLLASNDIYNFIFSKNIQDGIELNGTIYNVEHIDYIRSIISSSHGIRLTSTY